MTKPEIVFRHHHSCSEVIYRNKSGLWFKTYCMYYLPTRWCYECRLCWEMEGVRCEMKWVRGKEGQDTTSRPSLPPLSTLTSPSTANSHTVTPHPTSPIHYHLRLARKVNMKPSTVTTVTATAATTLFVQETSQYEHNTTHTTTTSIIPKAYSVLPTATATAQSGPSTNPPTPAAPLTPNPPNP